MPWFRVDDGFHSHPKVLATSLSARGLWATAGSWSSHHLTDGLVPDHVLASLGGTPELAAELVTAGLWRRRRNGYQFHNWAERNPSKEAVENDRKSNAERQRRWRQAHSNGHHNAVTNAGTNPATNSAPSRRDGSTEERTPVPSRAAARASPTGPPDGAEPWCGHCDERTRMRDDRDDGRPYHCPECSPRAWRPSAILTQPERSNP